MTEDNKIIKNPDAITVTTFDDRIEYYCTGSGAQTLVIPDGAFKIDYELVGGKGGKAGTSVSRPSDTPHDGGDGAYGQKITGSMNGELLAGKTVTLYVGQNGGMGNSFSGGNGGGGYRSGGNGGYNYSEGSGGWYGAAGGGGGGSSAIVYSSSIVVAGGGGGGGARMYLDLSNNPQGKTSDTLNTNTNVSDSAGDNGTNSGASFNGAGGGGGGGRKGGSGGFAYVSGNDISGEGGYGGEGFYSTTYNLAGTTPTRTTANVDGYIKLIVYQAPSYIRVYNNEWKTASKVYIHNGTSWQQMKQVFIKHNNVWKKIYG